jgi:ubiquinol-cytochrome c reductase cytochrome c subunit
MKRISKYRRHPLAAVLVILMGLLFVGSIYSFASSTSPAQASNARSTAIKEGQQIFLKGCSSCHGLNAEGTGSGPSLIGAGAAAVDFQVGTGRMPMADASVQAMARTPQYTPAQTMAIAEYIASLAPGPAIPSQAALNYERDGNLAQGGALFRTNCAMCHNFAGQGGALTQGKYAASLMGVDPQKIYEAMITGPQSMPVFGDRALTPVQKLSIIKWLKNAENEKAQGGIALGKVGPVTEGLLVWTLGLGLLIGAAVWLGAKSK